LRESKESAVDGALMALSCYFLHGSYDVITATLYSDILYDSWSPAMTVSSVCISILSMLSSSTEKVTLTSLDLSTSSFQNWVVCIKLSTFYCCSNARKTMTAMLGIAAMEGRRRRQGGGSMMTKCNVHWLCCLPAFLPRGHRDDLGLSLSTPLLDCKAYLAVVVCK
jgi:hypothetical protein